ncbi:uncharacterized protein LOC119069003 [Bradysia coprophila]|uniref:uncharacterized protein LOC119069003 n=1 Tax=Bradysia coprophila TaxID=38358 RepID=UPI00187D72F9|nr:uncharacterized protein LOC119069003 [Bradysia coprophila]
MYQRIFTLAILSFSPVFCDDCASEFDILTNHYYELGCTPVSDQSGVIDQFQCPDFETFDKEKCHLFGKVYNPHDIIDMDNIPRKICVESCFCGPRFGADFPAKFNCHYNHCFEQGAFYNKPCVFQRSFSNCCAEKIICDDQQIKELHQCYHNDRSYREGEIIDSIQKCYECICDQDFNNETDVTINPNCQKKKHICNTQLYDFKQYQLGCVPVYYGKHPDNCPTHYKCPKDSDEIIKGDSTGSGTSCKFGKLVFQKGDKLIDNCVECLCSVPPMLTCRQYSKCLN